MQFNLALQHFQFWAHQVQTYYCIPLDLLPHATYEEDQSAKKSYDIPPRTSDTFTKCARNWLSEVQLGDMTQVESPMFIALLTACYDGLHTLTWRANFPTIIESYAWRVSALLIGSSGVLLAVERAYTCWVTPLHFRIRLWRYKGNHDETSDNSYPMFYGRCIESLETAVVLMVKAVSHLKVESSCANRNVFCGPVSIHSLPCEDVYRCGGVSQSQKHATCHI